MLVTVRSLSLSELCNMSRRNPLLLASLAMLAALAASTSRAAESSPEAARLETFAKTDGEAYFALSLSPSVPATPQSARQVVILFDTSASQTGIYRDKALNALDTLLTSLATDDRVQLIAVDVSPVQLSNGFTAPGSNDMQQAVAKLHSRVPLGTTDMAAALNDAVAKFQNPPAGARSVIYIGDGMSIGDQLPAAEMKALTARLVESRIPVISYAIGPRIDHHLLGALANHTGGMVGADGEAITARQAGEELAKAAAATVYYPTNAKLPEGLTEAYPQQIPPLRSDRDTVLVGAGQLDAASEITMTADAFGKPVQMNWTVQPAAANVDNSYLARLVDNARDDGGLGLSFVGTAGLQQAKNQIEITARNLSRLGAQALAGNPEQAKQLAAGALALDPNNVEAEAVQGAAENLQLARFQEQVEDAPAAPPQPPAPGALPPPAPGDPLILQRPARPSEGELVEEFDRRRQVIAQRITADVLNEIDEARRIMAREPALAIDRLKVYEENVRRAPELDADTRSQLLARLHTAMRQAQIQEPIQQQRLIEAQTQQAIAEERIRVLEDLNARERRLEQLMERFNSLMAEQRYFDAEDVADLTRNIAPERPTTMAAMHTATMTGYAVENEALRQARQRGVVDTLATVERSHIPTPDEPPILYPSREFWQALTERRKEFANVSLDETGPAEKAIRRELDKPTVLEFIETPLTDVILYLKDYHKIEIQLDQKALDDAGVGSETPITRNLRGITLKSALRLLLKELDLTYLIDNEVLLITTRDEANQRLTTKVYPVADLVLPVNPFALTGGGAGFGGGGSQVFGGQGGGGFGGGGGGFGGGGQGGGGGGFFNVRDDQAGDDFRAFAVKDDLKLSKPAETGSSSSEAKSATETAPAARQKLAPIAVDTKSSQDADALWNQHFAAHQESKAAVRETVRQLMSKHEFKHVIALVQAALRHRQGQPWMYEVLDLAMQANGNSAAERERVLLSAVDFSDNTNDLMYVALYMGRTGLESRALKLFQQVSQHEPTRYEPYMHGLTLAERTGDMAGIQWATVGILSQAWPKQQAEMWQKAYRVANVTLKKLRDEKRGEEADAYETALNGAMVRDCIVVVSWTGEADIDLMVEEPAGTVCSFRSPRTSSGGIMLGDAYAAVEQTAEAGTSEVYVCPQGFDGTYRMLLRRVWGKPTAGKVTVDVFTHYNTDRNQRIRRVIPLEKDEAMVTFDLADGRRKQPLADEQIALAVQGQAEIRRDILAQQIAQVSDSSTQASNQVSKDRARRFFGRGGRSAVGYQPVIITLDEGASLFASAVISADRRYVRITPMPIFSGISEVNTFNFASGSSGQTGGGTGGQGFGGIGGGQGGGGGFGGGGQGGFGGGGGGQGGFGGGGGGFGGGGGGFGGGGGGQGGGFGGGGAF
jgi:uncharacterized membrane protein YgcG